VFVWVFFTPYWLSFVLVLIVVGREESVAQVWKEITTAKFGGPPLRKFIIGKRRTLDIMRHDLFEYACDGLDNDD
jgi:hypothetical protein